MFYVYIRAEVRIAGCPEEGLPALDWRRKHGFPDRCDNRIPIEIGGVVGEIEFRQLVEAGWTPNLVQDAAGSLSIREYCGMKAKNGNRVPHERHFAGSSGWRPIVECTYEDNSMELLIKATKAVVYEASGAKELELRIKEAEADIRNAESKIASLREQLAALA